MERLLPIWRSGARSFRRLAHILLVVGIVLIVVVLLFALMPPCLEACGPSLLSIINDPILYAAAPLLAAAAYGFRQASLLDAKVRGAERGPQP